MHPRPKGGLKPVLELVIVVAIALLFDFTNGFHDAANAIATSVSTRSISPRLAVVCAGALNFAGAFLSLKVATTIGKGIIDPGSVTLRIILAGLVGAIAWNLVTWWRGIPTSSSHALIGGVAGAAIAGAGSFDVVKWDGLYTKVVKPSVYAPILGFALAAVLSLFLAGRVGRFLDARPRPLKGLQLVSAGFVALTHGTNDAQKTMGVIALALVAAGQNKVFVVDDWVIAASATAIALGTYIGGWRIVATLGRRVSTLDLRAGVAAQTSAAFWLWQTASLGFPISTTQVITGSVLGSGAKKRFAGTRWSLAGGIATAWVVTIPCAGLMGAGFAEVGKLPGGEVLTYAAVVAGVALLLRHRRILFGSWEQEAARADAEVAARAVAAPAAVVGADASAPDGADGAPKRKRRKTLA
jgi:PiT family inorganic phosphate transporter